MPTIAERLIAIRGDKSRRSFADELGAKESTLRNYEQGVTQPTADFLERVCKKLRISSQWLLLGEGVLPSEGADSQGQADVPSLKARVAELEAENRTLKEETTELYKDAMSAYKRLYEATDKIRELQEQQHRGVGFATDAPASVPSAPSISQPNE